MAQQAKRAWAGWLTALLLWWPSVGVPVEQDAPTAPTVVVYALEAMPYCGEVDGRPVGLAVELLDEATRLGAPRFEFRFDVPWLRAQARVLQAGTEPVAIIPFSQTPQRLAQYSWLAELFTTQSRFYSYGRDVRPVLDLDEARRRVVGVVRGHALIKVLQQLGVEGLDSGAANADMNARKLLGGRYDTIADSDLISRYSWKALGQPRESLLEGMAVGPLTPVYLAAGPEFPPALAAQIRAAMLRLQETGRWQAIMAAWQ
ncbi:transporter substrate-binding domain-containing protein [Pseudaeromonas paramecii]|uniref:Solute-binding protein family 3/N-terminal domain-containing protein n=1 Tax=Pseudaeromonas paramecii TaxID=2138166 RepID=A0ABP8Q7Z6_9GAMM